MSSRTYLSSLERGLKSPTLKKLEELCKVLEVHPLTLLTLTYMGGEQRTSDQLLEQIRNELAAILAKN